MSEKKFNITDSFNVQIKNYSFFCERRETIGDLSDYDGWFIQWNKDSMKGTINLQENLARTAVFQILDGFKV